MDWTRLYELNWGVFGKLQEGRCKSTWKREFKLPWREAGPPNHHDDTVDSEQQVVNKELSLFGKLTW